MPNPFARYVEKVGAEKVAQRLGVSRSMVSRLKNGSRLPSLELALKVQRVTKGAVALNQWTGVKRGSQ